MEHVVIADSLVGETIVSSRQRIRNESMIEKHKDKRSRISKSHTAPKYTIRNLGKEPADLRQRVSTIHAMDILGLQVNTLQGGRG